jgi:hypothetical protein
VKSSWEKRKDKDMDIRLKLVNMEEVDLKHILQLLTKNMLAQVVLKVKMMTLHQEKALLQKEVKNLQNTNNK